MYYSIMPAQAKKAAVDLGQINRRLKDAQRDVKKVSLQMRWGTGAYSSVSNTLTAQSNTLDDLIAKLATMEDGLERAVEIFLQGERRLSSGIAQNANKASVDDGAASIGQTAENIWNIIRDFVDTGVWNNSEKANRIRNDKAMAKELKKLIESDRYSKSTWKKASVEERKQILRELFAEMQSIYGVSLYGIRIEPIKAPQGYIAYGQFIEGIDIIRINESLLSDSKYYEDIMETMAHEMRHAYQYAVKTNPENYEVDAETVEEWRNNYADYKDAEDDGYEAYRNQPIERDARRFAAWVI